MQIQHIRNATIVLEYGDQTFLIDPMLADRGTLPAFGPEVGLPEAPRQDEKNPLVDLPSPVDEIIAGVDAVIVTHLHPDHWDEAAISAIPKDIQVFSQNEEDASVIRDAGFTHVEVLKQDSEFNGVKLSKTAGEHGRGEVLKVAGHVCGIVFSHDDEKTLYVAGDTVWNELVKKELKQHNPDVIVVNGGDNQFLEGGSLVMGKEDIQNVHQTAPNATILSVHMEAVNHWTLSRSELKSFSKENNFDSQLIVPNDGDVFTF